MLLLFRYQRTRADFDHRVVIFSSEFFVGLILAVTLLIHWQLKIPKDMTPRNFGPI